MHSFLMAFGLGLLALAPIGPSAFAAEEAARPNILYIFSDDHALQAISAYKNSRYADYFETPTSIVSRKRVRFRALLLCQLDLRPFAGALRPCCRIGIDTVTLM